ncbi:MAG: nucleoside transporter C-terminal domain-containing protein [Bacteroidales bacterium]
MKKRFIHLAILLFTLLFTIQLSFAQSAHSTLDGVVESEVVVESKMSEQQSSLEPQHESSNSVLSNPYKEILMQKRFVFSPKQIFRGVLGMALIILIAWLFSTNRKQINWRTVLFAIALQLTIAIAVIASPAVQSVFEFMGSLFIAVLDWTKAGSNFLFGSLMNVESFGFIFVLQILPTIIFFSALTSLFFYLGILQKVVWVMAWLFTKAFRLTGAESLSTAGNIFLGQTEAPLMVKEYIPKMTKSEIMLVMTAGMSTMAGGVLAAYIGMLGGGDRVMELQFAKHLLSASIMAAPGAIAISKIMRPQTEEIDNSVEVPKEKIGKNILDAISNGTTEGLKLAANVGAMLLVFYALIAGFNAIFMKIGSLTSLNPLIASITSHRYEGLSMQFILSYLFSPIIWLTGVSGNDTFLVGRLLGEKLIMTEFIGYQSLAEMLQSGAFASAKSAIMATYVLCGFANFASIGILIGGVGGMAPNQKPTLSAYGFRALLGATLVALMSAAMVGMIIV